MLNSRVLKFRCLLFSPIFAGFRQFWRDSGGRCGAISADFIGRFRAGDGARCGVCGAHLDTVGGPALAGAALLQPG